MKKSRLLFFTIIVWIVAILSQVLKALCVDVLGFWTATGTIGATIVALSSEKIKEKVNTHILGLKPKLAINNIGRQVIIYKI